MAPNGFGIEFGSSIGQNIDVFIILKHLWRDATHTICSEAREDSDVIIGDKFL